MATRLQGHAKRFFLQRRAIARVIDALYKTEGAVFIDGNALKLGKGAVELIGLKV